MALNDIGNVALLSIHPKYADAILDGNKGVEFRKTVFRKKVQFCAIYSTSPEQKIIGVFEIEKIERNSPEELWRKYHKSGSIQLADFKEYYSNRNEGFAIIIKNAWRFDQPIPKKEFDHLIPIPQNFLYLEDDIFEKYKHTVLRQILLSNAKSYWA